MRKTILVSSINPTYSQEQPETQGWQSFAVQQQQEGPTTETPPGDQQQQQQQQQQDDDPFKGLNLENADDATKQAIEKIRLSHAALAKEKNDTAAKLERVAKAASNYQSEADRAKQILKRHNLTGDEPNKVVNPESAEDQTIQAIATEYVKRGMKPEQAQQWAEMMHVAVKVAKPGILNEVGSVLGPAITQLNAINGDRYLTAYGANAESQVAFKIPGVYEGAKAIVDQMIANKIQVTEVGVQNAIQMAVGEALMKSGGDLTKLQEMLKTGKPNTTTTVQPPAGPSILATLFGGNLNGNGHYVMPVDNNGKRTPVAANEHTAQAALICAQMMDKQSKQN